MYEFFEKLMAWICPHRRNPVPLDQPPVNIPIPENGDDIDDALRLPSMRDDGHQTADDIKEKELVADRTDADIVMSEMTLVEVPAPEKLKTTEQPEFSTPKGQQDEAKRTVSVEKLIKLTVDTIKNYDMMSKQVHDANQRLLLEDVCNSLVENLIIAGCSPIGEEQGVFNLAYHRTSPSQIVKDGTPYTKLIRKGIMYNGEVKLLAIVEL